MPQVSGPVVLVLFDGWGYRPEPFGNVIAEAVTPSYDQLWEAYPHVLLEASGPAVGLSEGTVGSAAAGYATIAAGRPVEQPPLRLDRAVDDGTFRTNDVLRAAAATVLEQGCRLHLLGLVSDGQVVSSERHYFELLSLLNEAGVPGDRVLVHAILDGYDTPHRSGMNYLARFAAEMMRSGVGRVATLLGRSYGMADTGGWEATERAYAALVHGAGRLVPSAIQALQAGYSRGEDDVTLSPSVVLGSDGLPLGRLGDGDIVLCFNHRESGIERLLSALLAPRFEAFEREEQPALRGITLTGYSYAAALGCQVAFPAPARPVSLGHRLAAAGKRVAVVSEGVAESHLRRLVAGADPATVTTCFLPSPPAEEVVEKPERLTAALTTTAVELIEGGEHDLVVVSYLNADLAGHYGQVAAARRAVEALDGALPPIVRTARRVGATVLLSSCYGNVEELEPATASRPNPAHTIHPVPLVLINDRFKGHQVPRGASHTLADLCGTVLGLLGLEVPSEVSGQDLSARLVAEERTDAEDDGAQAPLEISAAEAIGMTIMTARQARAYYQTGARRAGDPESAALYRHLADEEARRIRALERRYELLEPGHPYAPPEIGGEADYDLPDPRLRPLEVLEVAIREELETYRIFTEIATRNLDSQGKTVLEQLASEELEQLAQLQRLSDSEAIRLLSAFDGPREG
ncbi:MAG: hypothetical protein HUU35_03110 [Armatimonadetes bacterium]|nr:hypothetical protein [Armatimonadota bacterium]